MKIFFIYLTCLFCVSEALAQTDAEINREIFENCDDTIVWFGADFSLFRLCNKRKVGDEAKLNPYIFAWNVEYINMISNVKLASLLTVAKVIDDKEFTTTAHENHLAKTWIVDQKHEITENQIANQIQRYPSEHKGIGLVYIIESFYKGDPSQVYGYFVWFDIESKAIIHSYKSAGQPSSVHFVSGGFEIYRGKGMPKNDGMIGYWYRGMVDATLSFTLAFKKSLASEE